MTAEQLPLWIPSAPAPSMVVQARAAMIKAWRLRLVTARNVLVLGGIFQPAHTVVSAMDLREWLDAQGWGGDRRWSGAVFAAPRGLWQRVGYAPNPHRHKSPTPLFTLNEDRARELGL